MGGGSINSDVFYVTKTTPQFDSDFSNDSSPRSIFFNCGVFGLMQFIRFSLKLGNKIGIIATTVDNIRLMIETV